MNNKAKIVIAVICLAAAAVLIFMQFSGGRSTGGANTGAAQTGGTTATGQQTDQDQSAPVAGQLTKDKY